MKCGLIPMLAFVLVAAVPVDAADPLLNQVAMIFSHDAATGALCAD